MKHRFPARQMPTSEASIHTIGFSQLYLALGDVRDQQTVAVRAWWKPQITLIWLGTIFMVIGALISLLDRRVRIGVAKRSSNSLVSAET